MKTENSRHFDATFTTELAAVLSRTAPFFLLRFSGSGVLVVDAIAGIFDADAVVVVVVVVVVCASVITEEDCGSEEEEEVILSFSGGWPLAEGATPTGVLVLVTVIMAATGTFELLTIVTVVEAAAAVGETSSLRVFFLVRTFVAGVDGGDCAAGADRAVN